MLINEKTVIKNPRIEDEALSGRRRNISRPFSLVSSEPSELPAADNSGRREIVIKG